MGKKKNKRFRAQLIQPTGLTVSKEEDANELETQSSPSIIADVLDQVMFMLIFSISSHFQCERIEMVIKK